MFINCFLKPAVTPTIIPGGCPTERDVVWRIQWLATAPESVQSARCPGEGNTTVLGLAYRTCLAGGIWGAVDASECESVAVRAVRVKVWERSISTAVLKMLKVYIEIIDCLIFFMVGFPGLSSD